MNDMLRHPTPAERPPARRHGSSLRRESLTLAIALAGIASVSPVHADESIPEPASASVEAKIAEVDPADRHFTLNILPLLRGKCFGCHGDDPSDIEGALDARSRQGLLRGGESEGSAIVPGDPDASPLVRAIRWDDLEMPPKENDRLTAKEIAAVETWVKAGAPWPSVETQDAIRRAERAVPENEDGLLVTTSGGLADDWTYRRYPRSDVWAFLPVEKPKVPVAGQDEHPVDAFVDAGLVARGLEAAPPADARTLIRRATYDLTGLPPTPEEIDAFIRASEVDADAAWLGLIDRLLASPHYGERWAQHWLDVVRYADTSGFSNDYERSNAWRYRDYVIRALNDDKPYDEFVVEQIAGDELRPDDPEAIVATGFLRMGPWGTAMIPQEEARQIYRDDLVHSVGQSFLSIPMRCARCHDHKFDPIPTRDYYRMYAVFAATQPAEMPAAFLEEENRTGFDHGRELVDALFRFADDDRRRLVEKREAAARRWYADNELPYKNLNERKNDPDHLKPPRHVGLDYVDEGTLKVREQDAWIWNRRRERYEPLAQSVYNGPNAWQNARKLRKPESIDGTWRPKSFVYAGGSRTARGVEVTPGVLSAPGLPAPPPTGVDSPLDAFALPTELSGRRLALARWIAHPANPLSTRSIVNRVWLHHFGRGLVATPNNFGAKGSKPSHPKLLDWLTSDFVDHGWRIKRLHRLIMTSRAYRRSTHHPDPKTLDRIDPNGESLAQFRPRMLSARRGPRQSARRVRRASRDHRRAAGDA